MNKSLNQSPSGFYLSYGKRMFDLLAVVSSLPIVVPVAMIVSLVVYLTHGSPIFFFQNRSGKKGEPFKLMKFRTMSLGNEDERERLNSVGRFLRSSGLDELPQLWNVLKGEMSLVGPRALLPEYDAVLSAEHKIRMSVQPGISGLVQIRGGKWLTWEERLDLDAQYCETASFLVDLKIILATIPALISSSRRGEAPNEFQRLDDVIGKSKDDVVKKDQSELSVKAIESDQET